MFSWSNRSVGCMSGAQRLQCLGCLSFIWYETPILQNPKPHSQNLRQWILACTLTGTLSVFVFVRIWHPDMMCHSVSVPIHEECAVKKQEPLQWRLKGGQLSAANGMQLTHNGHGKARTGMAASPTPPRLKHSVRNRCSPPRDYEVKGKV